MRSNPSTISIAAARPASCSLCLPPAQHRDRAGHARSVSRALLRLPEQLDPPARARDAQDDAPALPPHEWAAPCPLARIRGARNRKPYLVRLGEGRLGGKELDLVGVRQALDAHILGRQLVAQGVDQRHPPGRALLLEIVPAIVGALGCDVVLVGLADA